MKNQRREAPPCHPKKITGMTTITEAQLIDNADTRTVLAISVVPDEAAGKGFNLYAKLTWKHGDLLLVTQKKTPKNWTSTDRLLAHIKTKYPKAVTKIELYL